MMHTKEKETRLSQGRRPFARNSQATAITGLLPYVIVTKNFKIVAPSHTVESDDQTNMALW